MKTLLTNAAVLFALAAPAAAQSTRCLDAFKDTTAFMHQRQDAPLSEGEFKAPAPMKEYAK